MPNMRNNAKTEQPRIQEFQNDESENLPTQQ